MQEAYNFDADTITVRKYILRNFNYSQLVEISFMVEHMVLSCYMFPYNLRNTCVLLFGGAYKCQLKPIDW